MNTRQETHNGDLAVRINADNPNHHLWNNNGTWWLHYTVYPTPFTVERKRKSLRTKNLRIARNRRDDFLLKGTWL